MYCTQCGAQIGDSAQFCTACGKPVGITPPPAAHPAFNPPRRKLHRIMSQKKIAGVCAGYAEYFDADITLMRIIWVALLLLPPNLGIFAYLISWAVMPKA